MFGAIAGALGGKVVSGLMDNILGGGKGGGGLMDNLLGGGNGGGPLGALGNLAQKLIDPAGILGLGNQGQQAGQGDPSTELKDMIESLQGMIKELMTMMEGKESPEAAGKDQQAGKSDAPGELKDMLGSLKEMINEMMTMMEGKESPEATGAGQPITINTGAGDDTVTIGAFPQAAQSTSAPS